MKRWYRVSEYRSNCTNACSCNFGSCMYPSMSFSFCMLLLYVLACIANPIHTIRALRPIRPITTHTSNTDAECVFHVCAGHRGTNVVQVWSGARRHRDHERRPRHLPIQHQEHVQARFDVQQRDAAGGVLLSGRRTTGDWVAKKGARHLLLRQHFRTHRQPPPAPLHPDVQTDVSTRKQRLPFGPQVRSAWQSWTRLFS